MGLFIRQLLATRFADLRRFRVTPNYPPRRELLVIRQLARQLDGSLVRAALEPAGSLAGIIHSQDDGTDPGDDDGHSNLILCTVQLTADQRQFELDRLDMRHPPQRRHRTGLRHPQQAVPHPLIISSSRQGHAWNDKRSGIDQLSSFTNIIGF